LFLIVNESGKHSDSYSLSSEAEREPLPHVLSAMEAISLFLKTEKEQE
jgi:hypothetical protein